MDGVKVGQRVHVEFDGVITFDNGEDRFDVELDNERTIEYIPAKYMSVGSWPPQVGDVWEVNGKEFYARENYCYPGKPVMESFASEDDTSFDHDELDEFKALNPSLVRRRGQ